jgi:cupin fold WbuC family metalloprotein
MKIESASVIRLTNPVSRLCHQSVKKITDLASQTKLRRSRICLHDNDETSLQEMHICLNSGSYVRPAKHLKKIESLTVIDGYSKLILFKDTGIIDEVIELGPYRSGKVHYYRLNKPIFHTLFVETKKFLFHEVTEGPFRALETEPAQWAPNEHDLDSCSKFLTFLETAVAGDKFHG